MTNAVLDKLKEWGARVHGTPEQNQAKMKAKRFEHQQTLNDMLRVIGACDMNEELKMIMRMRIWGLNPRIFHPLTHEEIAKHLKCKVKDVERWEEDGVHNIKSFLSMYSVADAMDKFHADKALNKMLNPEKRISV